MKKVVIGIIAVVVALFAVFGICILAEEKTGYKK